MSTDPVTYIPTLKDFNVTRKEAKLNNGTRLVLFERPGAPIKMNISFFSGSRFDPVSKEGVSHFLEHMIVAGTKSFPSKDKLAAYIERLGGDIGASTGSDSMNVNMSIGDPNDFKEAIKVTSEILLEPLFDPVTIEMERGSILEEEGMKRSNQKKMLGEISKKLVFQETLLGRSTLGSQETIKSITKDDLLDFYKNNFTSGRYVIVMSGGIDIDAALTLAESQLSLPEGEKVEFKEPLPVIRNKNITVEEFKKNDQLFLSLEFRTIPFTHPDSTPLSIASEVLGGGRAAILARKLRYEKGLVYAIGSNSGGNTDAGTFGVSTSVSKKNFQEVMRIITEELVKLRLKGLTGEEIRFAKDKIIKSSRMYMQTSGAWAGFHTYRSLVKPDEIWTIEDFFKEVESVTEEDIRTAVGKYLRNDNWYLAICGDIGEDEVSIEL